MTQAVIYCRISRDRTGAGLGVERQTQDCEALAKRLGWTVVRVFTDNDISAFTGRRRPAYRDMLALLETGMVQGVACWHTDRLHRSPTELEEYISIADKHGVTTHSVQAGEIDLSTPSGRAVARTLGAWARYESEHKAERVRRAMHQAAAAGKFTGGPVPFGWRIVDGKPELHPDEAPEVAKATRAVLAGRSLGSVIRDLNARGITFRTGNPFVYSSLRRMLLRPRNAGLTDWNGEILGESQFPAIVSRDEWEAVRKLLEDPARRRSQSSRVRHLLAGLAVCGTCGRPMKSATMTDRKGAKRTVYRCETTKGGHPVRNAAPVEDLVAATVVARLSLPDAAGLLVADGGTDVDALRAESIALRQRMDDAAEQFAEGTITGGQLATITARIHDKLAATAEAMAAAHSSPAVGELLAGEDVGAAWEAADIEARRAVIDALMTVRIMPTGKSHGKSFDPESIRIEWKGPAP